MTIGPLHFVTAQGTGAGRKPAGGGRKSGPTDSYSPGGQAPPREARNLAAAARLLDSDLRLRKGDTEYRATAWCSRPDGSVFAAYADPQGEKAYLASVRPDGTVAWELPLGEGRVEALADHPDGSVTVAAARGGLRVSAEGRILARPTEEAATGAFTDGQGNGYLLAGGSLVGPGPGLADVKEVREAPEGGLVARTGAEVVHLGPGGSVEGRTPLPAWPAEHNTTHSVGGTWLDDDGDVVLLKQSVTKVYPPFHHGMEAMFSGPELSAYLQPDITYEASVVGLDPEGGVRFSVPVAGEEPKVAVLPDGTAFAAGPQAEDGSWPVIRVSPEGRRRKLFGGKEPVRDLRAAVDGSLLVRAGDVVSRRSQAGKVLETERLEGERTGFAMKGETDDGRVVFADGDGACLWACRLETGEWQRLTDPVGDHSARVALERVAGEAEPPKEVRSGEGFVEIGDVSLPVRD